VDWPVRRRLYARLEARARARLGAEGFAAAWSAGGHLSPHEAAALATAS
jgi:hypothetical protein